METQSAAEILGLKPGCRCGPKFGPPLRWLRLPQFIFHDDCCFHDFLYEVGGSETDRQHADDLLRWDMVQRIRQTRRWYSRPGLYAVAWIYYAAVRLFGRSFFTYRHAPPTH